MTIPPSITRRKAKQANNLAELAAEIHTEHEAMEKAAFSGAEHAWNVGKLLVKAKDLVSHGQWEQWVQTNCVFSPRSARAYISVARKISNRQSTADISLDQVLKLLSAGKKTEPDQSQPTKKKSDNAPSYRVWQAIAKLIPRIEKLHPAKGILLQLRKVNDDAHQVWLDEKNHPLLAGVEK